MEDLSLPIDGSVQRQIFHEGEDDLLNHGNPAFVSFDDPPLLSMITNKDTNDKMDDKFVLSTMVPMETDGREDNDVMLSSSSNQQEFLLNVESTSFEDVSNYDGKICRKDHEEQQENEDKLEYCIKYKGEEDKEEEEEEEDGGCARTDFHYCSFKTMPKSLPDEVLVVTKALADDSITSSTVSRAVKSKTRKSKRKMAAMNVKRKKKRLDETSAKGIKSKEDLSILNPDQLQVNTSPNSEKSPVENSSEEVTSSVVETNTKTLEMKDQNLDAVLSHVNSENEETLFQFENVSYDLYLGGETSIFSVPSVEEKDSRDFINQKDDFVLSQEIGESQSQFDPISASQVAILDKIWESQENVSSENEIIDSHPDNEKNEVERSTEIQSIHCNLEPQSSSNKIIEEIENSTDNLETDNVESDSKNVNENVSESSDVNHSFIENASENAPEDVSNSDSKKESAPEDIESNEIDSSTSGVVVSKEENVPEDIESNNVDSNFNKDIENVPENHKDIEYAPENHKDIEYAPENHKDVSNSGSKKETTPEDSESNDMYGSTPDDVSNLDSKKETVPENVLNLVDSDSEMVVIKESENATDNLRDESNCVNNDNENIKENELQTRNDDSNAAVPLDETKNYNKNNFPREETTEETSSDEDGLLLISTKQEDEVTTVDATEDQSRSQELFEETSSKLLCSDCPVDSEQMEKLESIEGWGPCLKKGTTIYQPLLTDYISNVPVESPLPEESTQNKPRMYCLQITDTVNFKFLQPGEDNDVEDSGLYGNLEEETTHGKGITLDPYISDEHMEVESDDADELDKQLMELAESVDTQDTSNQEENIVPSSPIHATVTSSLTNAENEGQLTFVKKSMSLSPSVTQKKETFSVPTNKSINNVQRESENEKQGEQTVSSNISSAIVSYSKKRKRASNDRPPHKRSRKLDEESTTTSDIYEEESCIPNNRLTSNIETKSQDTAVTTTKHCKSTVMHKKQGVGNLKRKNGTQVYLDPREYTIPVRIASIIQAFWMKRIMEL